LECVAASGILNDKIPYWRINRDLDLALAFAKFIQAKSIHPHFHLLTKKTPRKYKKRIAGFPLDHQ
jgi:glycerophosphoryl diester phosphodiesterase